MVGALGVPLLAVLFLLISGSNVEGIAIQRATNVPAPAEFAARALWVVSATALAAGEIGIIALSIAVIRRHAGVRTRAWLRRTLFVSIAAFAATLTFSVLDTWFGLRVSSGALQTLRTRVPMREFFHGFNAAGAVPTVFLVSAVAATLRRFGSGTPPGEPPDPEGTAGDLRLLLNSIGAMLAVAVIEIFALHNWAHACVSPEQQPTVRSVALTLSSGVGAFYTVFLAAVFIPAFMRLRYEAARMHREHLRTGTPDAHIMPSWRDTLGRLAAVVVPLLTGGALPTVVEALSRFWV